ncbi:competence protein ComEA [Bifidobacterium sp. DSM 109958]|uniref:Competence protein ComEA n=1 Tax=Bifidobacterium moraviense TaxID=2675323 RepID=A0A7Y0F0L7_9BIFI|nr:helix-hairpin-helix domain-containing protein [Bifidobacterium sp. DSM 109958]NMM99834.1 competence protein ComEA [Bifidobacterium sp. DSM 109958]
MPSMLGRLSGVGSHDGEERAIPFATAGPRRDAGPDADPDEGRGRAGSGRAGDGRARSSPLRSAPRLRLNAVHAVVIVLLLVTALSASLTMLLQQSVAMSSMERERVAAMGDSAGDPAGTARTSPDVDSPVPSADAPEPAGGAAATVTVTATPQPDGAAGGGTSPGPATATPDDGRIDINTASADELDGVTGIGPAIARRIVDHRERHGRFSSVDDLLDVPGIGAKTLAKMRDELVAR